MQALTDAGVTGNSDFAGAVGLGWLPNIDLPGPAAVRQQGPQTKECLQIIKQRTGQDLSSGNAASLALSACDSVFLHDGVATGYDMAWNTGCTCATYARSFDIPG
jgi:hypothetical protein